MNNKNIYSPWLLLALAVSAYPSMLYADCAGVVVTGNHGHRATIAGVAGGVDSEGRGEICYASAIRDRVAQALSHAADATGYSVQFSIGNRRVAMVALREFDRADIPYTANVFGGETIIYTTKDAASAVGAIMNRTIAALERDQGGS